MMPGVGIPGVEVTNISSHGFRILLDEREPSLPFDEFPWFADDVDLTVESIEHPARYPLRATGGRP